MQAHLPREGARNDRIRGSFRETQHRGQADNVYLIFLLGEEDYGIEILKVREIIGMMPITRVPMAPDFVNGVINLRGKVIPVVELRKKFALPEQAATERTCIVVVEIRVGSGLAPMGVVVDSLSIVLRIKDSEIEPPQGFAGRLKADYILGIAKTQENIKILLDIEKILAFQDPADVKHAA